MTRTRHRGLSGLAAATILLVSTVTGLAVAAQPGSIGPDAAPFVVLVKIMVKPSQAERFVAAMDAQAATSRSEPGVLDFRVYQSSADPLVFYSVENYRDKAAFEIHVKTPGTARIMAVLKEIQAQDPEAQFLHPMSLKKE